jgi:hypothetical protein
LHVHEEAHQETSRPLLAAHVKTYVSTPTSSTRVQLHIAPRLLVIQPHELYINHVVRCDYSSPGRTGFTSASPCAASTRLPVAAALHRLRRTSPRRRLLGVRLLRLLTSTSKLVEGGYYVINN